MKEIKLTQGKVTLVDDEDFEWLNQWRWHASRGWLTFYVKRKEKDKSIYMHRLILNAPKDKAVDHADRNGLNNQRENLRICSDTQNQANRRTQSNSKSGYKGVFLRKEGGKRRWRAIIYMSGRRFYIGYFKSAEEAAVAYNQAATKIFGEFAHLNKIKSS